MKPLLTLIFAAILASTAVAQEATAAEEAPELQLVDAADVSLDDFLWTARPIVVFADTPADPRYTQQIALLLERPAELIERDVVVIVDTDPDARTSLRQRLRPRGFSIVLIGKDGTVKQRKPQLRDVRELTRAIDSMPMRRQEIRERQLLEE